MDVLMSPEKVPSKFSMMDDGGPSPRDGEPPLRRFARQARSAVLRLTPAPRPQRRRIAQTSAAAW